VLQLAGHAQLPTVLIAVKSSTTTSSHKMNNIISISSFPIKEDEKRERSQHKCQLLLNVCHEYLYAVSFFGVTRQTIAATIKIIASIKNKISTFISSFPIKKDEKNTKA